MKALIIHLIFLIDKVKDSRTTQIMGTYQQQVDILWQQTDITGALEDAIKSFKEAPAAGSIIWEPPVGRHLEAERAD